MNARFVSVSAALVLSAGILSSPAFAQSYTAPAGISAAAAPGGGGARTNRSGMAPSRDDTLTTGSVVTRTERYVPRPYTGSHVGARGEPLSD